MDYYAILGVSRLGDVDDLKKGYRKEALRWHPDKNMNNRDLAVRKFREICEAYDVLSDPLRRSVYDQHGEAVLKRGLPGGVGPTGSPPIPAYVFHGDCDLVFSTFFGSASPFAEFSDAVTGPGAKAIFGNAHRARAPEKGGARELELSLSLEETFLGCTKKVQIAKNVYSNEKQTTFEEEKILSVHVLPGYGEGTKITFAEESDQAPGTVAADIVFTITERPHSVFKREGNDLVHVARIPLARALTGHTVTLPTLDGRTLTIPINDIVSPSYEKVVEGEGMPITGAAGGARGNLILRFDVRFPGTITEQQRTLLKQAFGLDQKPKVKGPVFTHQRSQTDESME